MRSVIFGGGLVSDSKATSSFSATFNYLNCRDEREKSQSDMDCYARIQCGTYLGTYFF